MYTTEKGGIIPIEASNHHKKIGQKLINQAIKNQKIDLISFSQGPGLPPTLVVGMELAKKLAKKLKIPLIGVSHLVAHLSIGLLLTKAKDPVFVFVSGANTLIISLEGNRYRIFGEALSIGLGNALDKFGRKIGLGFPPGPKIEQLAKKGNFIQLPYTVKGMDVEYSGIVTEAINKFQKGEKIEDLCYSLQEHCFAMLTEVTERALAHCEKKEVLLIGGVAANKRLCEMLDIMCKERNAKFYAVPLKYSGDQATMIAWQGILQSKNKKFNLKEIDKLDIKPRWRIDQIEVDWL
jgi:N6-L-threonylcarbamoyladenine synthase/protein kinase Bud32